MKTIELTRGKVALIDDADYELVSKYPWYASVNQSGNWYADSNSRIFVRMHRLIMNCPRGFDVDHRDCDGLNNQRSNLRVCTRSQNLQNKRTGKLVGKSSRYKGVYRGVRVSGAIRFFAYIKPNEVEKKVFLGMFKREIDAARAYDEAALRYFGEFARLNIKRKEAL